MPKITFLPDETQITVAGGTELQEVAAQHPNLPLRFGCRRGECGTCAIAVSSGMDNLTQPSPQEKRTLEKKGLDPTEHRLACQCAVNGDVAIKKI